jgi:hypothetical protein
MVRFFIAYDEEDLSLGHYFLRCKFDCLTQLEMVPQLSPQITEIPSARCTKEYIEIQTMIHQDEPFVFVAFSHGNENSLVSVNDNYITTETINASFNKTLFYSNSCLTAKKLGPNLIDNGCTTFIGYEQTVDKLLGDNLKTSLKCDTSGLNAFLSQDITVKEAFDQMKIVYSQEISKLERFGDILTAAVLINSRESLVLLGNGDLTKEDLKLDR